MSEIFSLLNHEIEPATLRVEVASSLQIPSFHVVGLPAPEISEARERIRAAIESAGFEFPRRRLVLNLSPASVRKNGTGVDLAMALAILIDHLKPELKPKRIFAWGELGLDGSVRSSGQNLRSLVAATEADAEVVVLPDEDRLEALRARMLYRDGPSANKKLPRLRFARNLNEAWATLQDFGNPHPKNPPIQVTLPADPVPDSHLLPLSPLLERVLGVSSAGTHHLLLLGPRGSGKSHALEWLAALQPDAAASVRIRQRMLAELTGTRLELSDFRAPIRRIGAQTRHTALIGSVSHAVIRPGEFSLAHGGLLIADEFPEWSRDSRESLREPLERGKVTLTRVRGQMELPARFTLAANGNFCPCGGWPKEIRLPPVRARDGSVPQAPPLCHCPVHVRRDYLQRLSGPVLDRTDIVLKLASIPPDTYPQGQSASMLERLREKIMRFRKRAAELWGSPPGLLEAHEIEALLRTHSTWPRFILHGESFSLRTRHKQVRVALSLALWDGEDEPNAAHFLEARLYRPEYLTSPPQPIEPERKKENPPPPKALGPASQANTH